MLLVENRTGRTSQFETCCRLQHGLDAAALPETSRCSCAKKRVFIQNAPAYARQQVVLDAVASRMSMITNYANLSWNNIGLRQVARSFPNCLGLNCIVITNDKAGRFLGSPLVLQFKADLLRSQFPGLKGSAHKLATVKVWQAKRCRGEGLPFWAARRRSIWSMRRRRRSL